MRAYLCDGCGKRIEDSHFSGSATYRIKVQRESCCFGERGWQTLDLCFDCRVKIVKLLRGEIKA